MARTAPQSRRGAVAGRLLHAASWLTTPLQPEDYLGLLNPLWSMKELLGRVEAIHRETADAATVLIRPARGWTPHRAGQFLGLGVEVAGTRRWRSYSLSSPPRCDGCLAITVKAAPGGLVSSHLVHRARRGDVVALSGPFGAFVLPQPTPPRLLFLTAGSGITPVMAILQELVDRDALPDTVLVHSAPTADQVIFGPRLRALVDRTARLQLHERHTREPGAGRFSTDQLPALCPDWATRSAWACGPEAMLDEVEQHWRTAGLADQLNVERFGFRHCETDLGGRVHFTRSDRRAQAGGGTPLAEVAQQAGVPVPAGCRIGMCGSCVATLTAGRVRDLHTGQEHSARRQLIRTCSSTAVGAVEIDL